jgi:putative RNA 2'-phosphotransferase
MAKQRELDEQHLLRTILHALRHDPWKYGLQLDDEGWALVEDLLLALRYARFRWDSLKWAEVEAAIGATSTDRFQIVDGRIRASYGHSVTLAMVPPPGFPPNNLFHGTGMDALPQISRFGLQPIGRRFVHLTADANYAEQIATTKAGGLVLLIQAEQAHAQGVCFRRANHHVWLAESVPPAFIEVQEDPIMA